MNIEGLRHIDSEIRKDHIGAGSSDRCERFDSSRRNGRCGSPEIVPGVGWPESLQAEQADTGRDRFSRIFLVELSARKLERIAPYHLKASASRGLMVSAERLLAAIMPSRPIK